MPLLILDQKEKKWGCRERNAKVKQNKYDPNSSRAHNVPGQKLGNKASQCNFNIALI